MNASPGTEPNTQLETADSTVVSYPPSMFPWLDVLDLALFHGKIKPKTAAIAARLARSGDKTTGRNVFVDVETSRRSSG